MKFASIRKEVKRLVVKGRPKTVVVLFNKIAVLKKLKKSQYRYNYLRNAMRVAHAFKFKYVEGDLCIAKK